MGHVPELLFTFGLSFIIVELVQVIWGRPPVPNELPPDLQGSLFTIYTTTFPISRGFIMLVAVLMMAALWLVLTRTRIGLVIQAALTHPEQVEALGHNVRRVFMLVFARFGARGLAGVIGGVVFVTEPSMAAVAGAIIFVVIVVAAWDRRRRVHRSLLIGIIQTFGLALDYSIQSIVGNVGIHVTPDTFGYAVWKLTIAQVAPVLPFLLLY